MRIQQLIACALVASQVGAGGAGCGVSVSGIGQWKGGAFHQSMAGEGGTGGSDLLIEGGSGGDSHYDFCDANPGTD